MRALDGLPPGINTTSRRESRPRVRSDPICGLSHVFVHFRDRSGEVGPAFWLVAQAQAMIVVLGRLTWMPMMSRRRVGSERNIG